MGEFQVIEGQPKEVQKLLNQWRHQFDLVIHGHSVFNAPENNQTRCVLTIERKPKTKEEK